VQPSYPNVIPLANSPADRLVELDRLCRTKVGEVLQAYLEAEADELVRRRRYERAEAHQEPGESSKKKA
jgi:transposase-like protein